MLSLFPPENATGNYVKVVQRIPVRIDFTNLQQEDGDYVLAAGTFGDAGCRGEGRRWCTASPGLPVAAGSGCGPDGVADSRRTGAGPTASSSSCSRVVGWTCWSGVVALETATQGVAGAMPEAMRSSASAGKCAAGHVDDAGWRRRGKAPAQLGGRSSLSGGVVGGGEDELGGGAAVGERGLELGGDGEGGGDAGDDLEGNVGLAEGGHLFGGAAEDERVAGLEAEDGAPIRAGRRARA